MLETDLIALPFATCSALCPSLTPWPVCKQQRGNAVTNPFQMADIAKQCRMYVRKNHDETVQQLPLAAVHVQGVSVTSYMSACLPPAKMHLPLLYL